MLSRILLALVWLLLLSLPAVQNAIALGIGQRFNYLLLF